MYVHKSHMGKGRLGALDVLHDLQMCFIFSPAVTTKVLLQPPEFGAGVLGETMIANGVFTKSLAIS